MKKLRTQIRSALTPPAEENPFSLLVSAGLELSERENDLIFQAIAAVIADIPPTHPPLELLPAGDDDAVAMENRLHMVEDDDENSRHSASRRQSLHPLFQEHFVIGSSAEEDRMIAQQHYYQRPAPSERRKASYRPHADLPPLPIPSRSRLQRRPSFASEMGLPRDEFFTPELRPSPDPRYSPESGEKRGYSAGGFCDDYKGSRAAVEGPRGRENYRSLRKEGKVQRRHYSRRRRRRYREDQTARPANDPYYLDDGRHSKGAAASADAAAAARIEPYDLGMDAAWRTSSAYPSDQGLHHRKNKRPYESVGNDGEAILAKKRYLGVVA
eukprot:jgi/Bigna1/90738/estExt_fgenesh1_pg.C_780031